MNADADMNETDDREARTHLADCAVCGRTAQPGEGGLLPPPGLDGSIRCWDCAMKMSQWRSRIEGKPEKRCRSCSRKLADGWKRAGLCPQCRVKSRRKTWRECKRRQRAKQRTSVPEGLSYN